ncbi:MAG: HNH endonuclease signature motif containing protein, partial [Nitrososphaerales archaeon]
MSQILNIEDLSVEQTKFLSKITKDVNGCWIWNSSKNKTTGYGIAVSNRKMFIAHRLSYMLFKDIIQTGLVVHHICHVKLCVNPDHLQAITQKENLSQSDGLLSNSRSVHNSKKTHCPKGHEYTEKIENGKRKRFCCICRESNKLLIGNHFTTIDPIIAYN